MYTKESYFCKYPDGKAIWFAPDAEIKEGYIEKTLRLMLYPEKGNVLRNKKTGDISYACWLRDTEPDDWEEIVEPTEGDVLS